MYRLIFYSTDLREGETGAGETVTGAKWRGGAEVSRLRPQLALQYYPCQILTLPGWFMSPVSYTLYIYTDGMFPLLEGGVICTPTPYFNPLHHIYLSRFLLVT
jgi:hypothetical protein